MSAFRALATASRTLPLLRRALVSRPASRAFAVSAPFRANTPATTQLAQKLRDELDYEVSSAQESGVDTPQFLSTFKKDATWDIQDTPGNDEVFLTRKFGDENIRVMFSIADIQNFEDELDQEPEQTEDGEPKDPPTELRVSVSITKSTSPAAMGVDLYCTDGAFQPVSVSLYPSKKIGTELTIESDFARRTLYTGPPFETLDVALQENIEAFLEERGLTAELAAFVPEYAQYKEQKEYVQWLEHVGKFVEA